MKVYLSADIEGVTGVTHWDEADRLKPDYSEFREQMTQRRPCIRPKPDRRKAAQASPSYPGLERSPLFHGAGTR